MPGSMPSAAVVNCCGLLMLIPHHQAAGAKAESFSLFYSPGSAEVHSVLAAWTRKPSGLQEEQRKVQSRQYRRAVFRLAGSLFVFTGSIQ